LKNNGTGDKVKVELEIHVGLAVQHGVTDDFFITTEEREIGLSDDYFYTSFIDRLDYNFKITDQLEIEHSISDTEVIIKTLEACLKKSHAKLKEYKTKKEKWEQ
jgi:hypothetical protein